MGEMIQKPDTNPVVVALLNFFLLGGVGYILMGQQKKGIMSIVATLVLSCLGIGFIIPIITAYDAYLVGQKLQSGESVGMNENGLDFLNAIFKD
jgi:preprotein translocase subunit Sss1